MTNYNQKKINELLGIIENVKESNVSDDNYNIGFRNGIEFCLSLLEGRNGCYKNLNGLDEQNCNCNEDINNNTTLD